MQSEAFKPVGQELSVRGGNGPMMPSGVPFSAVPVGPLGGQSVRDITGRAGARRNSKSAPPQGARQVALAGAQAPPAPQVQAPVVTPPEGTVAPMGEAGLTIPRRPDAAPARMGAQRPFLQRPMPRMEGNGQDAYVVTLSGMAPDGQIYDVEIPFRATFPPGTQQITPHVQLVEGGQQG